MYEGILTLPPDIFMGFIDNNVFQKIHKLLNSILHTTVLNTLNPVISLI